MDRKLLSIAIGVAVAVFILKHPLLYRLIESLGAFGYLGGFVAGIFYTSVFTAVPATAVFLLLAQTDNLFLLPLFGGLGAVVGDYVIYRFFRRETDDLVKSRIIKDSPLLKMASSIPMIKWLTVIVGALIVASPFPDEIGIALLGITRIETKKFLPISFILNTAGIFVVVTLGKIF